MKSLRFALVHFLLLCLTAAYGQSVKSPNDFLPHRIGDKFTPHHMLNGYFEYLANATPATMKLVKYGLTNEDRPLQIAIISSQENMARLEDIRLNNLRLAGMAEGDPSPDQPAIVWISMSVHGNEAPGSESSMPLAYDLATGQNEKIREYLKNTVVIIDPSVNPDGYDRYTHWNRMAGNKTPNPRQEAREHREPWPGGRPNHYYYDLNRDWAWATQAETRQRLAIYHQWLPHVHPDVHEQGINDPYFFAPAAEPVHEYVTPWQREFQAEIGKNHAGYFDEKGWLYFTKEVFDLFYPSYGDTYPTFNGAIGMTYEQAGGPRGGRAVITDNGDTLKLGDRILHHYTTCMSTIEVSSKFSNELVKRFGEYYKKSATQPQGQYKGYIIRETNDPNKINEFCALLDRHHIRYGRVGAGYSGIRAFDYISGKETSVSVNPNDIVISAYQPHSTLLQALLEPEPILSDSSTYDITAWSLIFAHGLDAYALKERIEPKKGYQPYKAPEIKLAAPTYSWCIHRRSLAEVKFVAILLQKGVRVRTATQKFDIADQQFAPGAYVINRGDNKPIQNELDDIVRVAASETNVTLHPIFSGMSSKGGDLGSDMFRLIPKPEIAVVYCDDTDDNSYGYLWYFFEQETGYPFTPVHADQIGRINLYRYTTLIFPDGRYSLDPGQKEAVRSWVKNGGRLIAIDGAIRAFSDMDGFDLDARSLPPRDSSWNRKALADRQRAGISDGLPGAIIRAKVDNTNPLAFGFGDFYYSLKTGSDLYESPAVAEAPIWVDQDYQSYGFIGSRVKPALKGTPVVTVKKSGYGDAVYFIDNPLFRSFWQQGKLVMANAVFY